MPAKGRHQTEPRGEGCRGRWRRVGLVKMRVLQDPAQSKTPGTAEMDTAVSSRATGT